MENGVERSSHKSAFAGEPSCDHPGGSDIKVAIVDPMAVSNSRVLVYIGRLTSILAWLHGGYREGIVYLTCMHQ